MEDNIILENVEVGLHGDITGKVLSASGQGEDSDEFMMMREEMSQYFNNEQLVSIIAHHPRQNEICAAKSGSTWHRVQVSEVLCRRSGQYANCMFVDEGKEDSVPVQWLRKLPQKYRRVPLRVRRVHLHGIKPLSMMISEEDLMVSPKPVKEWDESAVKFIHDSIKAAVCVKCSVMEELLDMSLSVRMYLQSRSGTYICLNEVLVKQNFAISMVRNKEKKDAAVKKPKLTIEEVIRARKMRDRGIHLSDTEMMPKSDTELNYWLSDSSTLCPAERGYATDSQGASVLSHRAFHKKDSVRNRKYAIHRNRMHSTSSSSEGIDLAGRVPPDRTDSVYEYFLQKFLQECDIESSHELIPPDLPFTGSYSDMPVRGCYSDMPVRGSYSDNTSTSTQLPKCSISPVGRGANLARFISSGTLSLKGDNSRSDSSPNSTVPSSRSNSFSAKNTKSPPLAEKLDYFADSSISNEMRCPSGVRIDKSLAADIGRMQGRGLPWRLSDQDEVTLPPRDQASSLLPTVPFTGRGAALFLGRGSPSPTKPKSQEKSRISPESKAYSLQGSYLLEDKCEVLYSRSGERFSSGDSVYTPPHINNFDKCNTMVNKSSNENSIVGSTIKPYEREHTLGRYPEDVVQRSRLNIRTSLDGVASGNESDASCRSVVAASVLGCGGFTRSRLPKVATQPGQSKLADASLMLSRTDKDAAAGSLPTKTVSPKLSLLLEGKSGTTTTTVTANDDIDSDEEFIRRTERLNKMSVSDKKLEMMRKLTGQRLMEKINPKNHIKEKSLTDKGMLGVMDRILVHGSAPCPPAWHFPEHFSQQIHTHWEEHKFPAPYLVQSYSWPAILRGRHVVAISPPGTGKTMSYLYPLITFLCDQDTYKYMPSGMGPFVIILAPTWSRALKIYSIVDVLVQNLVTIRYLVVHGGGREETMACTLINGCEILIATPPSLRRILDKKYTDLRRLCHLVIDDADQLLRTFCADVQDILSKYKTVVSENLKNIECPRQLLVLGAQWNTAVEQFMKNCLSRPLLIITSATEASLYGKVKQVPHMCRPDDRMKQVLGLLENLEVATSKIIIFSSSKEDIINLYHALNNCSHYSLMVHQDMELHSVRQVRDEWEQKLPLLICCDDYVAEMHITNATCIIHYDLPGSKTKFSNRISCMINHFYNFTKEGQGRVEPISHLIITDNSVSQMRSVMDLLERSNCRIDPEVRAFLDGIVEEREENENNELCTSLLGFGFCREKWRCRYRHRVIPEADSPDAANWLPNEGEVKVMVTHVQDATHYFVRLLSVRLTDQTTRDLSSNFSCLSLDLSLWYNNQSHQKRHTAPFAGELCGYQDNGMFYRVQILELDMNPQRKTGSHNIEALVQLVDIGKSRCIPAHKLYELPEHLKAVPFQAVEVFVCNLKPMDMDSEWTSKANLYVHELVYGKIMEGKIVMRLGYILWLDPLVMRVALSEARAVINKFYVHKELLNNGLAEENKEHLKRLFTLFKRLDEVIPIPKALLQKTKSNQILHTDVLPACRTHHKILVSSVSTPALFFVQRQEKLLDLEEQMEEIGTYIEGLDVEEGAPPSLGTGDYCLAQYTSFDSRWYRGQVTCVLDDQYEVFFADYGDKDNVPKDKVRDFPHDKFYELPLQAIECQLADIKPTGSEFEEKAGNALWEMSHFVNDDLKELVAEVQKTTTSEYAGSRKFIVHIYETKSDTEVHFGEELVWRHLAEAEEGTNIQPLFTQRTRIRRLYKSLLDKIPDLCADVYYAKETENALDLAEEIVRNLKLSTESVSDGTMATASRCLAAVGSLIGRVGWANVHSLIMESLLLLVKADSRLSQEFISKNLLSGLIRCLEMNSDPLIQHQAVLCVCRLANTSSKLKTYFQQEPCFSILTELFETTECEQVRGSVCRAFATLCTGSERVYESLMKKGVCQKLVEYLRRSPSHMTTEEILSLVATLSEHDSNDGDVLKESLIGEIVKNLSQTSCDKCIHLSVQLCDSFAATRRKHKKILLELHMVQKLKRVLELQLQPTTAQVCKDLLSSLVVKVPSEPLVATPIRPGQLDMPHSSNRLTAPEIEWSQNSFRVMLRVKVTGVTKSNSLVNFSENSVAFRASAHGKTFAFEYNLYDKIKLERCEVDVRSLEVVIAMGKVTKGKWPRLLQDKEERPATLKVDFDRIVDSSDSEVDDDSRPFLLHKKKKGLTLPGSGPKRKNLKEPMSGSETESDDSMEDLQDPDDHDQNYYDPFRA